MPTYTPLQSIQLTSTASTVTFSNIPQNYQDLVIVASVITYYGSNTYQELGLRFNGNSDSIYGSTNIYGTGSSAASARSSSQSLIRRFYTVTNPTPTGTRGFLQINVNNYSNTTTNKTVLIRSDVGTSTAAGGIATATVGSWANTSAINAITLSTFDDSTGYLAGSTFDLYAISPTSADTAQAFGGTEVYYTTDYVYHVFKGSGTFTPYRNLTCDYLIVAGGAGARWGGGGAGGLRYFSSQSLTALTNYTVTIGAGGIGVTSKGTNSSFSSNSASGGGYGSGGYGGATSGGSGGGGGSVSADPADTGGAGNSGSYSPVEGYAGGNSVSAGSGTGGANAGGGGGAGGVGGNGTNTGGTSNGTGGVGGIGSNTYSSWATATNTGISGYYAAGGAGGSSGSGLGQSGATNTGNGAKGNNWGDSGSIQNGGSGIVIVRYAR